MPKIISEKELLKKIFCQIYDMDADDLATLAEHIFGCKCFVREELNSPSYDYELELDKDNPDNYGGTFGDLES